MSKQEEFKIFFLLSSLHFFQTKQSISEYVHFSKRLLAVSDVRQALRMP